MDVFICGVCHMGFHDIGKFVDHKNSLGSISCGHCTAVFHTEGDLARHALQEHAAETQGTEPDDEEMPHEQNMDVEESAEGSENHMASTSDRGTAGDSQTIVVTESFAFEATENSVVSDIFACSMCQCFALSEQEIVNHVNECHERTASKDSEEPSPLYCRLQQLGSTVVTPAEERRTLRMLPVDVDVEEPPTQTTTLHLVVETSSPPMPPKRRRGRPRKVDQMQRPVPVAEKVEEQDTLTRGQDGLFHCSRCKRVFCKERHILGHKCMAKGDYVDSFDKKDDEGSVAPEEDAKDADTTEDFRLHRTNERESWTRGRGRRGGYRGGRRGGLCRDVSGSPHHETVAGPGEANKENVAGQEQATADKSAEGASEEAEELPPRKLHWREDPRHVPVFSRDEERLAFEEHLNQVDLSCVDHLYTQHQVAQEITCPPGTRPAPKEVCDLHVFSCNVCKKVFKTQSHMRLHCLIHTELKPFTCHQCDFSTNAKGNLYTHMRKHTGNYFKCSQCDFRSCNRSHMAEHEATHSSVRQRCELCSNDYNTIKSLVNHVRKYHTSPAGKRYLATFQSKQLQNMAVLHVCHLCNRKFKKKVDRDRHLFVHNVPEPPTAYQCGLCGYQASRRTYLENHYRKHRLVYVCSVCCGLHLSATALRAHLQKEHIDKRDASSEPKPDSSIECFVAESGPVSTAEETVPAQASSEQSDTPEKSDTPEPTQASTQPNAAPESEEATPEPTVSSDATLESLFADSISQSWYLPEPDGIASGYANIPQELTEGSQECDPDTPTETQATTSSQQSGPLSGAVTGLWSMSQLHYKQLNMEVYAKIREVFGEEECPDCGRLFHSRIDLDPHRLTHTDDKPYKCSKCPYSSGSKDNLKRHQETAHEGRTFPCERCDFVAQSRSSLFQHRQKHTANGGQGRCPVCQRQFPSWRILRQHLLSQHPDAQQLFKVPGGPPRVMGRLGRRTYKCPYCGRVFHRSSTDLQKHMWIHEGVKPFRCPDCPYQCRSRNNLNVHRLTHSNDKPHLCDQCGKGYKSKAALRLHTRTHGRGALYPCDKCEYTATQKCHLKRHLETHDIIRRYICEHCSYSSNTINYMKVHYSRKHRGEVFNQNSVVADPRSIEQQKDRVYKCLSCSYIFGNMNDMKRHLRLKHGVCLENLDLSVEEVSVDALASEAEAAAASAQQEMTLEPATSDSNQPLEVPTESNVEEETEEEAVSLIQHMVEQGALTAGQEVTLQTLDADGLLTTLSPEAIIVREQDGQPVLLGTQGSYLIQYVQQEPDGLVLQQGPHQQVQQEIIVELTP
uniref:C2H2-type domain-containing protein n=1 Tax=Hyalomma excavatum TaxID=257692 RepID=A0A131XEX7_9ACAR